MIVIAVILAFLTIRQLLHTTSQNDAGPLVSPPPLPPPSTDKIAASKDSDFTEADKSSDDKGDGEFTKTTTLHLTMPTMTIVPEPVADQQAICLGETAWKKVPISDLNTTITVPENIKYSPAGPRPDQVILLTASDGHGNNGGIKDIVQLAEENRKAYCKHHGYIYHFVNISKYDLGDSHAVWKKIPAIVETFNTYPDAQWVFWLDLDAIIMTPEQDLNSLLLSKQGMQTALAAGDRHHSVDWDPMKTFQQAGADFENTDLLIAQDHNGINAGSFLIRRSKYTQWLLDMWADPFFMQMTWPGKEQDTLVSKLLHRAEAEFTDRIRYTLSATTNLSENTLALSNSVSSTASPKARVLCNGRQATCSCISRAVGRQMHVRTDGTSSGQ